MVWYTGFNMPYHFFKKKIMETICIDPGHGGQDFGAVYGDKNDYVAEKNFNLSISFFLLYELMLTGYHVIMTRSTDETLSLYDRCMIANKNKCDLFISIHGDAFGDPSVSGSTTHISKNASVEAEQIACLINDEFKIAFPSRKNRGTKKSNFYVLKHTQMSAVLVECDFLSNPKSRRFLKKPENQMAIAKSICHAVSQYTETNKSH